MSKLLFHNFSFNLVKLQITKAYNEICFFKGASDAFFMLISEKKKYSNTSITHAFDTNWEFLTAWSKI